jgi:hypothetical protein
VRAKVLAAHELHRVGRHRRQPGPRCEPQRPPRQGIDGRIAGALHLEIEPVGKDRAPALDAALRLRLVVLCERPADVAERPARERDQAFGRGRIEPGRIDLGAAAALVEAVGAREQLGQIYL